MNADQIKHVQERIGVTPDGFWGPKSISACKEHLRALMPSPNPWPSTDQQSLTDFYGKAGDESNLTNLAVSGLGITYEGSPVKTVRCHNKVASSLLRILTEVAGSKFAYILKDYAGCFNDRPMRGSSTPSLHARGAAIDFRPDQNGNLAHWPSNADMPIEVMEMFAKEGWKAAGAFWGRDAMHHEATN